ncbi:AMP-binding protein [Kineobactrum salinum]|uniref:AMP-binding protein n=1 Tax=Kineobactrum salinum TaxID=2708301 RepID=A0A6C0U1A9_9GAMM|nr:AMP-binding protein [Kineobactrum salinum]QIB65890.1 AMP-binding protein [Kineobactrum salinum]
MAQFTFAPLTPSSFLDRSAASFAARTAVVDGQVRFTYAELAARVDRLVSALASSGIKPGDRVAALCTNSHIQLELHQGVPLRGAVLVPVNTRLAADEMAYILKHSETSLLVASREFSDRARELATAAGIPLILEGGGTEDYETWLAAIDAAPSDRQEVDEHSMISLNYTSGTTGPPKGVMLHHRGAYLGALAMAHHTRLDTGSTYLWTLPMFHCNGWCFTWAVIAGGGTNLCLRAISPSGIWRMLREEGVTHFCGAPTVLTMIAEEPSASVLPGRVDVYIGGAPPSPALLARVDALGLHVTHLYGLTETFGPSVINEWQPQWDDLPLETGTRLRARQGTSNIVNRPLKVLDTDGNSVPPDGQSVGEIAASGNLVMLGYYKDEEATRAVTRNGCFLTGDLGVMHPDGYVELRDRSKDIIISGGENVASVEVEQALDSHPSVIESAVVGMADEKWGEIVVAYVTARTSVDASPEDLADDIAAHVRQRVAGYKVPRRIIFSDLPKTSTGKIQKNVLRKRILEIGMGPK